LAYGPFYRIETDAEVSRQQFENIIVETLLVIVAQQKQWSPPAPTSRTSVTLEGDEL
jgi:hypothetical protein